MTAEWEKVNDNLQEVSKERDALFLENAALKEKLNSAQHTATQQTAPPVNKPKELIIEEDEPCAYCCDTALVDIYLEQRGWKYCPKCGDKLTGSKSLMDGEK